DRAWVTGPFPEKDQGLRQAHPPEQGAVDLAAAYPGAGGKVAWGGMRGKGGSFTLGGRPSPGANASYYLFVRLESGSRQPALLLVSAPGGVKLWHNGRLVWENTLPRTTPGPDAVFLDAQPGSNDLLVRVLQSKGGKGLTLHYRSRGELTA